MDFVQPTTFRLNPSLMVGIPYALAEAKLVDGMWTANQRRCIGAFQG